jgi:hypothetical protein
VENERANEKFQVTSAEADLIPKLFSPSSKAENGEFLTATDIVLRLTDRYPTGVKLNVQMIGKAMRQLGFEKCSHYTEERKHSIKGYFVKAIT